MTRICLQIQDMDLAGSPYRMERMITDLMPGWAALRVQRSPSFNMGFPRGESWSKLRELSEQADIVHIHHLYFAKQVIPLLSGRPKVVVSVRGSPDRERRTPVPKGVYALHSCHWDLLSIYPQAEVIPNFVLSKDIEPHFSPVIDRPGPVQVYQPVAHRLKHPQAFAEVRASFHRDPSIAFRSQEGKHCGVQNSAQLAAMARSDVVWDNLQGNSGNVSMEALALGALPITVLNKVTRRGLEEFFQTSDLPHHFWGGPKDIAQTLRSLAGDRDRLTALREASRNFWEAHWRDELIMEHWYRLYEGLV